MCIRDSTYIKAETSANADEDELLFVTADVERMIIKNDGKVGISTSLPAFSLDLNTTDGIKIPAGGEDTKPTNLVSSNYGLIRYNTDLKTFEGYGDGGVWGSLGGIIDADQDTYIKAESSANADEDELLFVTNGSEKMIIKDDGKVGIGTITPSSLLSLSGDDTTIKIQDSKNDDTGSTNIELINGPVNSFDDNTNLYNWRISNSNNQYILASGSNNQIYERFVISGETGNVGLGTQPHIFTEGENDEYKMTVKGSINVDGFIYKNGEIYRGEGSVGVISQNMPIQTQSITYTKTRIMTSTESNSQNIVPDNGWRFIDNNLTSGFVIKIKPSHVRSKILLNISCHVGFDSLPESRWWGLKLYRKIEGYNGGNWMEVSEANGDNTDGFSSCWLSHNMGANLSAYENFITNVSGTFFDEPFKGISSAIKNVYYTVKWKSNLGTYDTNSGGGELYFNRPAVLLDTSNSPVLSSSWAAQEVWQLGTPYIPGEASNVITIFNQDHVGIGNTEPQHTLDIDGNINITGTYLLNNVDVFTDSSNYVLRIDGEVNTRLDTTDANLATTDAGIITTSNILFLQSSNFDAHTSNYVLKIDGEVNTRLDTTDSNLATTDANLAITDAGIITTSNILFLKSSNFDAHTSNYVQRIDDEITTRINGVDNVDNILGFFRNTQFEKDNSDYINIRKASANNIGGIKVGNNTTIDNLGFLSVNMTSYIGNVELKGDLVTSNLTILGDSTTLETNVFTTERLEINNTGTGAAISVTQTGGADDIFIASNSGGEVFSIINNGNVGIGITNPQNALDVDGNVNISSGNKYKINGVNLQLGDIEGTLALSAGGTSATDAAGARTAILPSGTSDNFLKYDGTDWVATDIIETLVVKGGNSESGSIVLNCENNSHSVKIKAPPHADFSGDHTLTLPNNTGTVNQVLSTDGNGVLSFVDQTASVDISGFTDENGKLDFEAIKIPNTTTIVDTTISDEPVPLYNVERLYPSQYARQNYFTRIDGVSPDSWSVVSSPYGDGTYNVKYSSYYSNTNYSPHYIFSKPSNEPNTSQPSNDSTWASNYNNGNYVGSSSLNSISGDWITIQMPIKILLTKYVFVSIHNTSGHNNRLPRKYSILGCNDDDGNWEVIYSETLNQDNDSDYTDTYYGISNIARIVNIPENSRLTGTKTFNTFGLIVEKIGRVSVLAIAEWDIFGKEDNISAVSIYSSNSTDEFIYPPYRYFTYDDSSGSYSVENGSVEEGNSTSFTYNYTLNDPANTVGNNEQTSSTDTSTHGMGTYEFELGGPQTAHGRSSGIFIYGLSSDYTTSSSGDRPGVNGDDDVALPNGAGWYVGTGWTNSTTYNSSYYYNSDMPGAWIKIKMPKPIELSSFSILGGMQAYRSPKGFKIYGSNTDTTNFYDWTLLHTETAYSYDSTTKLGPKNTTNHGMGSFKNYLLVVNEIMQNDTLLVFQGWYIYGKEPIGEPEYKYLRFTHDGSTNAQTEYDVNFPEDTTCDILIIGGGGAGGNNLGGGGGAGGIVYTINQTLNGTYKIGVGKGGTGIGGSSTINNVIQTGKESYIKDSNGSYIQLNMGGVNQDLIGFGGGTGGGYYTDSSHTYNDAIGQDGGSGGGASDIYNNSHTTTLPGGTATQANTFWNGTSYIAGGASGNQNITNNVYETGGGGAIGGLNNNTTNGKNGIQIDITGTSKYYAGGGGGGIHSSTAGYSTTTYGLGGSEIGGNGAYHNASTNLRLATSGENGTGSGGGGKDLDASANVLSGSGGSGIVIIRYSMGTTTSVTTNSTGYLTYDATDGWNVKDENNISTSNLTASNLEVSGDINFTGNLTQNGITFSSYSDSDVVTVLSTSDGTGITWNSGTNKFDNDITQYADSDVVNVLSASDGTGITWNSGTNKFDNDITQYADSDVVNVLSASDGTGITWNSGTNKFDNDIIQYADSDVVNVLSASAVSYTHLTLPTILRV